MRTKGVLASVIVLLLVAGGAYLYMNMGGIAKSVTEKVGTKTLGVKVSLGSVDIDLKTKTVTAKGLEVDNPEGYSTPHAVTVDTIQIALDSFSKELLTFTNISTSGAHIYMDAKENRTNLTDIRKGINARASAGKDVPDESRLPIIIRNLRIDDATIHPTGMLANEQIKAVKMPGIGMKNIGARTQGVLVSEAMAVIFDEIIQTSTRAAMRQGLMGALDEEALRAIQDSAGLNAGILDQIQTETENMGAKLRGMFEGR